MPLVTALNHAVLFGSDVDRSVEFYSKALGMSVIASRPGAAAFMRAPGSTNHHDLAVMQVPTPPPLLNFVTKPNIPEDPYDHKFRF